MKKSLNTIIINNEFHDDLEDLQKDLQKILDQANQTATSLASTPQDSNEPIYQYLYLRYSIAVLKIIQTELEPNDANRMSLLGKGILCVNSAGNDALSGGISNASLELIAKLNIQTIQQLEPIDSHNNEDLEEEFKSQFKANYNNNPKGVIALEEYFKKTFAEDLEKHLSTVLEGSDKKSGKEKYFKKYFEKDFKGDFQQNVHKKDLKTYIQENLEKENVKKALKKYTREKISLEPREIRKLGINKELPLEQLPLEQQISGGLDMYVFSLVFGDQGDKENEELNKIKQEIRLLTLQLAETKYNIKNIQYVQESVETAIQAYWKEKNGQITKKQATQTIRVAITDLENQTKAIASEENLSPTQLRLQTEIGTNYSPTYPLLTTSDKVALTELLEKKCTELRKLYPKIKQLTTPQNNPITLPKGTELPNGGTLKTQTRYSVDEVIKLLSRYKAQLSSSSRFSLSPRTKKAVKWGASILMALAGIALVVTHIACPALIPFSIPVLYLYATGGASCLPVIGLTLHSLFSNCRKGEDKDSTKNSTQNPSNALNPISTNLDKTDTMSDIVSLLSNNTKIGGTYNTGGSGDKTSSNLNNHPGGARRY